MLDGYRVIERKGYDVMTYTLTATMPGERSRRTIHAADSTDATFAAIKRVLDLAYADKEGPWALGRIELRTAAGRLIHSMDAKGDA